MHHDFDNKALSCACCFLLPCEKKFVSLQTITGMVRLVKEIECMHSMSDIDHKKEHGKKE